MNGDLNVQLQYFTQQPKKSATFNSDESASLSSEEDDFLKTTSAPKQSKTLTDDVRLQISQFNGTNRTTVGILDVYPDSRLNTTQITISCLNFLFGGMYELEIVGGNDIDEGANTLDNHDERLRQQLDVRWPQPKLSVTPESIGTYPQQPVDVILEFPGVECIVPHTQLDKVPEFWLELYFCGHEVYCDSANVSSSQVLYAEQIRGYPKARLVKLSCELFGLAGHYVVKLRPIMPVAASVSATAYIQVNPNQFHYLFFQFPLCIAYGLFRFHFRRLSFFLPWPSPYQTHNKCPRMQFKCKNHHFHSPVCRSTCLHLCCFSVPDPYPWYISRLLFRLTGANSSYSMYTLVVFHHAIRTLASEFYLNIQHAFWTEPIEFGYLANYVLTLHRLPLQHHCTILPNSV